MSRSSRAAGPREKQMESVAVKALHRVWWLAYALALLPLVLRGAPPASSAKAPTAEVELFAGMKAGQVEAKIIPKDAKEGTLTLKNKTDQPITIRLPEAFAAVPVLAQLGGGGLNGGGGGLNGGGGGGGGGNQG